MCPLRRGEIHVTRELLNRSCRRPSAGSALDYWVIERAPLGPVPAMLYDMPETRIDLSPPLETSRYFLVLVPRARKR
jgi:hypothetical protein